MVSFYKKSVEEIKILPRIDCKLLNKNSYTFKHCKMNTHKLER